MDPSVVVSGLEPMYLDEAGKQRAVGDGTALVHVNTEHAHDGSLAAFRTRFRRCADEIIATTPEDADVLLVTHGDVVAGIAASLAAPVVVYDVSFCGVVGVDRALTSIVHAHSVQYILE